jgi:nucleotide-binding universal stress UspA family protein
MKPHVNDAILDGGQRSESMTKEHLGPVVVAIDGSETSLQALVAAREEAAWRNVPLHVVHVEDITPAILHLPGEHNINTRELVEARCDQVWATAVETLGDAGVPVQRVDLDGHPASAIISYAREVDAGLVVLGSRGHGRFANFLLGSTAHGVVTQAHRSVMVVKPD